MRARVGRSASADYSRRGHEFCRARIEKNRSGARRQSAMIGTIPNAKLVVKPR
jgi:hypothetical protein